MKRLADSSHAMTVHQISQIENGARRPDADDVVALAAVLEVSPLSLLYPLAQGRHVYREVSGVPSTTSMTDLWLLACNFITRRGERALGIPREVLTTEDRQRRRANYLAGKIDDLEAQITQILEDTDGRGAVTFLQQTRDELLAVDPADETYWSTAEFDPAPPGSEDDSGE